MSPDADRLVRQWCQRHLGSSVARQLSHHEHLTQVYGVQLRDGRQVAVKVRDAAPRVATCAAVHRMLWQRGFPCPQPLAGPAPLSPDRSDRMATAEEWLPGGDVWLGPDAASDYAGVFAHMIAVAPRPQDVGTLAPPVPWLHFDHHDPERIWPPPASARWDPHRIESDLPAPIREVAMRVRRRLLAPDVAALPPVVAHGDFEAQNVRWFPTHGGSHARRPVVLDWDSVVAMPEAIVVGNAASGFVSPDQPDLATLEQTEQFLAVYQHQRGRTFTAGEVQVSHAAGLWVAAYNAAFEHLKGGPGPVTAQLQRQAAARLDLAGA